MAGARRRGFFGWCPGKDAMLGYGAKVLEYGTVSVLGGTAAVGTFVGVQEYLGVYGTHVCVEQVEEAVATLANATYVFNGQSTLVNSLLPSLGLSGASVVLFALSAAAVASGVAYCRSERRAYHVIGDERRADVDTVAEGESPHDKSSLRDGSEKSRCCP